MAQYEFRLAPAAALFAAAALVAACGDRERTAEAEAPGAEAEVSTELPESQVSDTQLEAAAEGAAAVAATPGAASTGVVVTPPKYDSTGAGSANTPVQSESSGGEDRTGQR